jgi:hypothetical protein
VETDPAYAAAWFLDYGNAVEEVLSLGDRGTKLEALAFSTLTLYTITSMLPPAMVNEIRGAKRHGTIMLRMISSAISKARMEAVARSMTLTDNMNERKAIPSDFYPDGISRTHPNCRGYQHPETTGPLGGHF